MFNYQHLSIMAKIKKTRILTVIESRFKKTAFVIEMTDGTRWYTTKGGHVAFNTYDNIRSYTNIDNLSDNDLFSYYGDTGVCEGIETMSKFVELVKDQDE